MMTEHDFNFVKQTEDLNFYKKVRINLFYDELIIPI